MIKSSGPVICEARLNSEYLPRQVSSSHAQVLLLKALKIAFTAAFFHYFIVRSHLGYKIISTAVRIR